MLKTGDPKFYEDLFMSDEARNLLKNEPEKFKACCNGVGSQSGFWNKLIYPFIPQTAWGVSLRPASDIHDVEYTYPDHFYCKKSALKWKKEADKRFKNNCYILIKRKTKWRWLLKLRILRAREYYFALSEFGEEAFLTDKHFTKKF